MKIISWNLNHRVQAKAIPAGVIEVIRTLTPDILVLTEYVDGESRADFKRDLCDVGLPNITVSEKRPRHNQVLIASRVEHAVGDVPAPGESHGHTNFLSVSFRHPEFTLIGVRAPAYKSAVETDSYWVELTGILDAISTRKVVVIGDLNGDPEAPRSIGGKHMRLLGDRGWTYPKPSGPWSYISSSGRHTSRIDHMLASPSIGSASATYITKLNGTVVAGPADKNAISDHAILLCEVAP